MDNCPLVDDLPIILRVIFHSIPHQTVKLPKSTGSITLSHYNPGFLDDFLIFFSIEAPFAGDFPIGFVGSFDRARLRTSPRPDPRLPKWPLEHPQGVQAQWQAECSWDFMWGFPWVSINGGTPIVGWFIYKGKFH